MLNLLGWIFIIFFPRGFYTLIITGICGVEHLQREETIKSHHRSAKHFNNRLTERTKERTDAKNSRNNNKLHKWEMKRKNSIGWVTQTPRSQIIWAFINYSRITRYAVEHTPNTQHVFINDLQRIVSGVAHTHIHTSEQYRPAKLATTAAAVAGSTAEATQMGKLQANPKIWRWFGKYSSLSYYIIISL